MPTNRLQQLAEQGQSIWLDNIDRTMLHNGDLERRIREDALTGMTSNPTIFEKALAEGSAYDEQLLSADAGQSPDQLFELVETTDVRSACDIFGGVYQSTRGGDGYVSIEVSPGVANDAQKSIDEACRLWKEVDRPNVMVKIPGTEQGAVAVRELTSRGINVNITLLFSLTAHERVIDAYMAGLEARIAKDEPIDGIFSVASFFVSRVDTEVDKRLDAMIKTAKGGDADAFRMLKGRAAIANAKLAYRLFRRKFDEPRWKAIAEKGGRVQQPLWASTSVKNPAYRDVMYAEELIGPDTIDTMPPSLIDAFREHGEVERTVDKRYGAAEGLLREVESVGISMKDVTDTLLRDGLASFQKSFDTLTAGIAKKMSSLAASTK
ncbi:MAG TPA: transaldolase [Gemmatimonadaceae bacterium]|jgi:transaldolase|nr:transaldolase [Gemmatimonadaceae bacterium]